MALISFNGRTTPAAVPADADYDASQVVNAVSPGTLGTRVSTALAALLALIPSVPVQSVFARVGNVVAAAGDYLASQVTNDSGQAGTNLAQGGTLSSALDELRLFSGETTQTGGYAAASTLTLLQALGFLSVATSTLTARIPTAGTFLSRMVRAGLVTTAVAGNVAFVRTGGSVQEVCGTDGYGIIIRNGISAISTNMRFFWGIAAVTLNTDVDPATLTDIILLGATAGSGNLSLYTNDAAGAATVTPLGANFPVAVGAVYELYIKVLPGAAAGYVVRVRRLDTVVADFLQTFTVNVPTTATFVGPNTLVTNHTDAQVVSLEVVDCRAYRQLSA